MGEFYNRLMDVRDANNAPVSGTKLSTHETLDIIAEFVGGEVSATDANTVIGYFAANENGVPQPLGTQGQQEVQTIINLVTVDIPVTGTAVQQADARARRALEAQAIHRKLLLGAQGAPFYNTPALLASKLSTPGRTITPL